MGIDEAGMAEIEAEIVANPTHPMIRGLKGARKGGYNDPGWANGAAGAWSITRRLERTDST
jgi:hypothetical protein